MPPRCNRVRMLLGCCDTVPHAVFGLCFERAVAYVTSLSNVRDAIPFPRTPGNATY